MADYLAENDTKPIIFERKLIFQFWANDIEARANRKCKYKKIHCRGCINTNQPEPQIHTLQCKTLTELNERITNLPTYSDLSAVKLKIYVSRIIQ